ncbi:MAG: PIN domain-containing protein [Treponema sp.]|jgi:predicted nucleic acid-binding protein|nr:PIN domain-containing protein [Treponema sp.]
MNKPKVYIETTMFNYYFDKDRDAHLATVAFFEAIGSGNYEAYTSQYAVDELLKAPEPKKSDMLGLLKKYEIVVLPPNEDVRHLADVYLENEGIPEKKRLDALHIAIASINRLDFIVSCNFKHINKLKTKRMVEYVNFNQGYNNIIICRPEEIIDYEE